MKNIAIIFILLVFVVGGYLVYATNVKNIAEEVHEVQSELSVEDTQVNTESPAATTQEKLEHGPTVQPISHASMVLSWAGLTVYVDPVGDVALYADLLAPDIVLVTDIHGDHLSIDTLEGIIAGDSVLIVPQAVYDQLSETLAAQAIVTANEEAITEQGFRITTVPMYNLPESDDAFHVKGRGNGYVIEQGDFRAYIAGDTSATPEMRALTDIDMAFVPMNLPYTMNIDEAADGVVDFAPKVVVPYHYRSQDGLSDVARFKEIVEFRDPNIEVLLLDWYGTETEESGD